MSTIESESSDTDRTSARERDLDNFLIEELTASRIFQDWILERLKEFIDVPLYAKSTTGKNPKREATNGQTDLSFVLLDDADNQIVHILIEDKVALGFQPGQAERYAEEVTAARQRLGHRRAAAVLVAPSSNRSVLDHPCFDVSIRLEEIIAHLRERRETLARTDNPLAEELCRRLCARINLLDALSKKRSYNGDWRPNPIPERVTFFDQYLRLASTKVPQFRTPNSSGGPNSTTMTFTLPKIRQLPALGQIRHEFRKGEVNLVLRKAAGSKKNLDESGVLPPDARTKSSAKGSLLVVLHTSPIEPTGERFRQQEQLIEVAIGKAIRLYDWAKDNAEQLTSIIGGT